MKTILILERLSSYFQVHRDKDLAEKLGVSSTVLSNWKKRNTIDYDLIFTICENVNINWLLTGRGSMLLEENLPESPHPTPITPSAPVSDPAIEGQGTLASYLQAENRELRARTEAQAVEIALLKQQIQSMERDSARIKKATGHAGAAGNAAAG